MDRPGQLCGTVSESSSPKSTHTTARHMEPAQRELRGRTAPAPFGFATRSQYRQSHPVTDDLSPHLLRKAEEELRFRLTRLPTVGPVCPLAHI
jgi:hypothetical protein